MVREEAREIRQGPITVGLVNFGKMFKLEGRGEPRSILSRGKVMARCAFEKNKTCVLWKMHVRKKN